MTGRVSSCCDMKYNDVKRLDESNDGVGAIQGYSPMQRRTEQRLFFSSSLFRSCPGSKEAQKFKEGGESAS